MPEVRGMIHFSTGDIFIVSKASMLEAETSRTIFLDQPASLFVSNVPSWPDGIPSHCRLHLSTMWTVEGHLIYTQLKHRVLMKKTRHILEQNELRGRGT